MTKSLFNEPWAVVFCRIALFVIYAWFGALKLMGASPAEPIVHSLFEKTISFMSFDTFYMLFAWFEVILGFLFLFPKATKLATGLFILHMISTTMPLFVVPAMTWQTFPALTLEGQYIVKNLALMACVATIATLRSAKPAKA